MSELFWVLLGFLLALIWDKYKDWQRFRFTIKLVANEVKEARTSLESKFKELPDDFKKIVKVAQEGGDISAHSSMLSKLPLLKYTMPYQTSAWQTFVANGYPNRINEADYKIISDAYNTLEGSNFIKGLVPVLLALTSSPAINDDTKRYVVQGLRLAPIYPVAFALPKMKTALDRIEKIANSCSLSSFINFIFK